MDMIIAVASNEQEEFEAAWESMRRAQQLDNQYALHGSNLVDYHAGVGQSVAEYLVPVLQFTSPLVMAVLTHWLTRRKATAKIDGNEFKDMSVDDMERLLKVIERLKKKIKKA